MIVWPFRLTFSPGRRRPTPDQLTLLVLGVLALIVPFFLRPAPMLAGTHTQLLLPPCLFYRLTGVPCLTCGMTTSFALLARGRFAGAFLAHPLGVFSYIYLAFLTAVAAVATAGRRAMHLVLQASLIQVVLALGSGWAVKLIVWYLLPR